MIRIWINERRGVSYIANLFNAFKRLAQDTSASEKADFLARHRVSVRRIAAVTAVPQAALRFRSGGRRPRLIPAEQTPSGVAALHSEATRRALMVAYMGSDKSRRTIASIYDAALMPDLWPPAFDEGGLGGG
jgi:hypothetical protein